MTTAVIVKVPEGASYVARVTAFQTASRADVDLYPGAERTFHAYSGCTLQIAEVPIEAADAGTTPLATVDASQIIRRPISEMFAAFRAELMALGSSREMSVALTHLDTARLWAGEHKGA